jgi:DNA-binding transcriptional LysR family regulator
VDLRQLGYFLAVVDHGGVTPAADAVRIAQPSLSQAIRSLERELGVVLFRRNGRGLTLTAAGEAFVAPARQVLRSLAGARTAIDDVVALTAGWLDIAAHDLLAVDPVGTVLALFHRRHPGVAVRLHSPRDEDEMIRLVLDGRCELALTYLPVPGSGLRVSELGRQEVWVALPPGSAPGPDPLPVGALDGLSLVANVEGHEAVRAAVRSGLRAAGVRMRPAVVSRHQEAVVPLVLAGAGVAFVSRWYAREAARRGAVVRRLDPSVSCAFGLLHRATSMSPGGAAFVKMLVDALADPPQDASDS